jgi:molybdopterin molybdotransferase
MAVTSTVVPAMAWRAARAAAYAAGRAAAPAPIRLPMAQIEGLTLAEGLRTLTPLPAFPTSSVDGYAVRGAGPWRLTGRVLAGGTPPPLEPGCAVEIATGASVPPETDAIVRLEDATVHDPVHAPGGGPTGATAAGPASAAAHGATAAAASAGQMTRQISGEPRPMREWREPGDEAALGEELLPTGTAITPGVIGLAATCGHDLLPVLAAPRTAILIFGDELTTAGPPGEGLVRDSLGPQIPGWLRRLGAEPVVGFTPRGPVADTLAAHVAAIRDGLAVADLVCTTGGTMRGPVDHLHPALDALGASYLVDTAAVRPGYPMLLAQVPGDGRPDGRPGFIAGLPGNPQSAVVGLVTLVAPLLAGLCGRPEPTLAMVRLGAPVPGRGEHTHLALVRMEPDGIGYPLPHAGSAMLRGLAQADGFAVIEPGTRGEPGALVPLVPLPLLAGERR